MKNSSSICSNSRERKVKLRGVTSLRNALPIWQMPNGTFCREESTTFLNCAKIACAVSGRRYALSSSVAVAPTKVWNIRLNGFGSVSCAPFSGLKARVFSTFSVVSPSRVGFVSPRVV